MSNYIRLTDDSNNTGKKLDAVSMVDGGDTVYRWIITIGDPTTAASKVTVVAANAALSETAAANMRTVAALFALDAAASANAQDVPLQVQSTASPWLLVGVKNGANQMPAMDAVARPGFVKVTDGTNTQPTMDAVARPGFVKLTDGTNTAPTMDAAARPGFQKITDGTNTMPTGDAAARPVYHALAGTTANGLSKAKARDLAATVTAIKASAGTLYKLLVVNAQAAVAFIQLFDVATGSVTLATTTPDLEYSVPANSSVEIPLPPQGCPFGTAISIASTTTEKGLTGSAAGVQVFAIYQ